MNFKEKTQKNQSKIIVKPQIKRSIKILNKIMIEKLINKIQMKRKKIYNKDY